MSSRNKHEVGGEPNESASFHSPAASLTALRPATNERAGPSRLAARAPGQAAVRAEITVVPEVEPGRKGKAYKRKRKSLTSKGRKAVVVKVLATVEAQKMAAGSGGGGRHNAAAALPLTAPTSAAAAVVAAPVSSAAPLDPAATCNLGKAWSKADLATLTRLAEDPSYVCQLIPDHPEEVEPDWEEISRHFGRHSRGGTAVLGQYYAVKRLMKEARREGRRGANYVDLVESALGELPERQGTVYEVQAVLKEKYAGELDKYKVKGRVRWKMAVGEVPVEEAELFEAAGKNTTGKIIWRLKAAPA